MARKTIILRTDSGATLGHFANVRAARQFAETLPAETLQRVLVIQTADGVVLSRRFPS